MNKKCELFTNENSEFNFLSFFGFPGANTKWLFWHLKKIKSATFVFIYKYFVFGLSNGMDV